MSVLRMPAIDAKQPRDLTNMVCVVEVSKEVANHEDAMANTVEATAKQGKRSDR
jgi:hypothetical protein